ncbi:MAG TPA: hypothetical protein P5543_11750, partial [Planctomycetota bacterium]|nr:hypothetical protein [Planctomycetota bacterium]
EPSIYTNLFKNITESTQYKNTTNNERYLHNLEQRLQQTPWDATLYKDSMFLLTEMAKMHFVNHQEEKAKEYQKKAEEKLRKYFSIKSYNKKIFTQFTEQYIYILNSRTLPKDLYISQEFINVGILSLNSIEFSDLFPYSEICRTYLQKEKSTWNKDKFDVYKKMFQNKDNSILLRNILTPLVLSPEFCKLYQEDKEIRELFQQEREEAIQKHNIQKNIKQLLAQYYLTRDTSYLSYIFTYNNKYIPTLHHILNHDQEYFFRFLAAYALSICKEKEAGNALEKTMKHWAGNLDSALLSYICAKKMDLQRKYPNILNVVPTKIADTTKLIFLQYFWDILDKDKIRDSMHKYISTYIQDKNPNISLLSMFFLLKTMRIVLIEGLKTNFLEYKIEYAKKIQQVWKTIKTYNEKHILFFIIISNKFSHFIKFFDAMDKNIIIDIHSILEQTQNPDIQENALEFLQHYSEDEYENIAQNWLQKDHLEENVKLFLISSIENQQIDFEYILKNKNISLYSKIFLLQAIIEKKMKFFFQFTKNQDINIELILKNIHDIQNNIKNYVKNIENLILHQDIDNRAKPFYIYILATLPNIIPIYDIKRKLLDFPNEVEQKSILLCLGSYPFLGYCDNELFFIKPKNKKGNTNNQAMFQEDIQKKLNTISSQVQPYAAYAYVMMETCEKMDALPKLTCFPTKEQKWGALYGYENILYYDFPDLPIQWNLQKKYTMFLQQLYMILQQSIGSTRKDCKLSFKEFNSLIIPPTKKNLQDFIDALTYSIQIAPEIADIAPEIAGSMNSIYDSILLQRYLERALVYLVASQKYRDKEKADYALKALNDIKLVIQHDKTTRILQKYYALILYNALQYNIIDKIKVQEQLEYAKMLYPWDKDIIQTYNNIVQNKDTSSEYKYKDIDWIFPQY